jgi:hypothetical protein
MTRIVGKIMHPMPRPNINSSLNRPSGMVGADTQREVRVRDKNDVTEGSSTVNGKGRRGEGGRGNCLLGIKDFPSYHH